MPYLCEFGNSRGIRVPWTHFLFFKKKSADDNKGKENYPACQELLKNIKQFEKFMHKVHPLGTLWANRNFVRLLLFCIQGRSLKDPKEELAEAGLKNGSKVMLIGKKVV